MSLEKLQLVKKTEQEIKCTKFRAKVLYDMQMIFAEYAKTFREVEGTFSSNNLMHQRPDSILDQYLTKYVSSSSIECRLIKSLHMYLKVKYLDLQDQYLGKYLPLFPSIQVLGVSTSTRECTQ